MNDLVYQALSAVVVNPGHRGFIILGRDVE